ncbi:MAG: protein translocase SEC61 complex subunit gamma [Thermofilaceae archaeon]
MSFVKNFVRTLRITKRPDKKTYRASLRIVALGLSLLGAIGYVFQLAGSALRMVSVSPISGDVLVVVLAVVAAVTLAVVLYLRRRY